MNDITFALRRRLVKDYNLPVHLHEDPYFFYLMDLYDMHWHTHEKVALMREVLSKTGGREENFFKTAEDVVSTMTSQVANSNAIKELASLDMDKRFPLTHQLPTGNIYTNEFVGRPLVSVDLKNANFNSLRLLGLSEELDANTYEGWMKAITPFEYFHKAKGLRQVVFGHLQPKRQQRLQRYVMGVFASFILRAGGKVISSSSDELIIEGLAAEKVHDLVSSAALRQGIPQNLWRVESFILHRIIPDQDFYLRASAELDGKTKQDLKMVPAFMMPQVYKALINQEVQAEDLVFLHEGKLSRFLEPSFHNNKLPRPVKP